MVHWLRLHASMWSGRGHGFDPWLGNSDPACCMWYGKKKKKKIRNNIEKIMDQPYLNVLVFKISIEFILAIISKLFEDNFYDSHLSKN